MVINILSNRSKWTFYFLQSVQVNFTIGDFNKNQKLKHSISEMNSSKEDKCEISNIIDKHIEIKLFDKHLYEKI